MSGYNDKPKFKRYLVLGDCGDSYEFDNLKDAVSCAGATALIVVPLYEVPPAREEGDDV